jgi:fructan beta-fructosidase
MLPLFRNLLGSALFCATVFIVRAAEPDLLIGDFEGTNYGDWTPAGAAFGTGPAHGTLPNQMAVNGYAGQGFASSFHGGDDATGKLTSAEFTIQRKYISFLIGGGGWDNTSLNLVIAGRNVRTATGLNTVPGGTEMLRPGLWEVGELEGAPAHIEVVDNATGTWGHINVDQIVQTDVVPAGLQLDATRTIQVDKHYLNLPVKNGAPKRRMTITVDGQTVRSFDIELADDKPDFWTFLDLTPFQGRSAVIQASWLADNSRGLASIQQSDEIRDAKNLYHEYLRPQFHFSSERGWLNDPNGLVFYKGQYHLYYQHNPYGWKWGNMHWGSAVSPDLVHWKELPAALYPPRYGDWAFSGSAAVDVNNTGSFKTGTNDVIVAAYTSTGRGECIVYSNDGGFTFSDYAGNPVIKNRGRDPRLFWYQPAGEWVIAVYDEDLTQPKKEDQRGIAFYTSPDLKQWTRQSRISGFYECPDIFELPVDGEAANKKWVLTAASSEYMVGQFDGKKFTPETARLPGHRGTSFYAAQTYNGIPAHDGRRIQIGWMRAPAPGMPFNQCMSLPLDLKLITTPDGVRLTRLPVTELKDLRAKTFDAGALTLKSGEASPLADVNGELLELRAEFTPGPDSVVNFDVRDVVISYDAQKQTLTVDGHSAPAPLRNGHQRLIVYVDRTTVEVFASDGLTYMPMAIISPRTALGVNISVTGAPVAFENLDAYKLRSSWE